MPNLAINFGRLLIFIGAVGYFYAIYVTQTPKAWTALIPAIFGAVLLALGYAARAKDNLRKHLMHAAVLVALLGFLAAAGRFVSKISDFTLNAAYISQIAMALTCLVFVALSVRSFINARKEA